MYTQYVCVCISAVCVCVCVHIWRYIYVCIYTRMCTHVYMCGYVLSIYVYTCVYLYRRIHVYTYAYMYLCVCVFLILMWTVLKHIQFNFFFLLSKMLYNFIFSWCQKNKRDCCVSVQFWTSLIPHLSQASATWICLHPSSLEDIPSTVMTWTSPPSSSPSLVSSPWLIHLVLQCQMQLVNATLLVSR